ncbi:MAG: efflux RND transporter permease subunit [Paludibacteraceae bacterium]|nr:efflux RND transporter permease subunit [Paludibacteraceae bacterium]
MRKQKRNHIENAMTNHGLIFFIVSVLVALGLWSLPHLNKDEFPQFTIRQGVIAAIYPGATAEEIELQVTQPLEEFLFTYEEIDKQHTHSETRDGVVYIFADLRNDVERKDEVWAKIRAGLNLFKLTSLPQGVLQVVVVDDFGATSSILLAVESEERSPRELEDYTRELASRLRTIPEMGNIKILGQQTEEIAVEIDANRLSVYGIDQKTMLAQMALQGFRTIGGSIGNTNTMIQVALPYRTEEEVENQIIFSNPVDGSVVRVKDIATVTRRYAGSSKFVDFYVSDSLNAHVSKASSLIVDIQMVPGNNIVDFGEKVDKILTEARTSLPQDLQFHRITDQPKVVNDSVWSFMGDIGLSMLVVIAVMLLLFPIKTALVAGLGVPICTIITFALLYFAGIELNTVTLGALIVVLGMIVDNSVIVVDGYSNTLEQGHSRWYSAAVSTKELFVPMVVATFSISGMFFPMTKIITGPLGEFIQSFPWTICFALGVSIFYAVWVTPYLATRMIKRKTEADMNVIERGQNVFFGWLQRGYHALLALCFRFPWLTIGITLASLILGVCLFTQLNVQMMPKAERSCFAVEIHLQEGSSLSETAVLSDSLARMLVTDSRITSITNFVGQASPRFHATYTPQMASDNYAQFIVNTSSQKATADLLAELTPCYENYFPNAYIRFKQMDYQAVKNPVEVYLKGDDYAVLSEVADSLRSYLGSQNEVTWVHDDYSECVPSIRIRLREDEAQRLGVTQAMLSLYLNSMLGGQTLTTLYEGEHAIPVVLYTEGANRLDYDALGDQLVPTAFPNVWVPLHQVADLEPSWHHSNLTRWNSERTITVGCDLSGNTSQPVVQKKVEQWFEQHYPILPEGVRVEYGGLLAVNNSCIPQIVMAILAAIAVMFIVLLYHFKKVSISLLTLSSCLLTLFGAFLGLYIFDLDFSITAVLGIVALIGVIVRNAIMMYEYAEELRFEHHESVHDAAFDAGLRRMRPIFLTSATTALGVIPMIIAHTSLWMPLGVVICLGTFFTLPLTLTFLPVIYWKVYEKTTA